RNEMRAIENWSERGSTDAAGSPNVNVTVVSKPAALDPFDSYSILKPAEIDWLIPKPSRRPFVIAALIGLILLGGAYAFSDADRWSNFSEAAADYVLPKQVDSHSASDRRAETKTTNQINMPRTAASLRESPREQRVRKAQSRVTTKQ